MATLEKIRSKSVLLFVIIIVALLAFILGDFLTSGRTYFGTGTTVAQVKNQKIDFTHYNSELEKAGEQMRNNNYSNYDHDELAQNVITNLLAKALMDEEYADLGITVTDSEISEAMTGAVPHPAAQQFIYSISQQLGFETANATAILDAIKNPAKYNIPVEVSRQLAAAWKQTEDDVEQTMLQQKFYALVQGLYTANELDALSIYNDNNETRHIAYVTKGYNTLPDTEVEITDSEIEKLWKAQQEKYALDEETRAVDYIQVTIEPSAADRLAGQQVVEDALLALNQGEGVDAVASDSRFVISNVATTASRINDTKVRDFVTSATDGTAEIVNSTRDNYTIVKRLGTNVQVDSVNFSIVGLRNPAVADSMLAVLKATKDWTPYFDAEETQGQDSVWISLVMTTNIDEAVKGLLLNAAVGTPVVYADTIQGQPVAQILKVNKRNAPVTVYDYATVAYTVDPSNETLENLNNGLRTYISSNSSGDEFSANAAEAGYTVLSAMVSPSAPHIANIPDSRSAVKWVMNAKKGQVSPVIGDNKQTYLLVVAVKDIYSDGYLPANTPSVRGELFGKAMAAKKGEKLVGEYTGKATDLEGYAAAMESEIAEGDAIFSSPRLATIGFQESELQAAVANAAEGTVVGPLAGKNGVVVFEVKSVSTDARPYDFNEYAQRFNRTMGIGTVDPYKMLVGKNKVKNHSLNFIQGIND